MEVLRAATRFRAEAGRFSVPLAGDEVKARALCGKSIAWGGYFRRHAANWWQIASAI